MKTKTGVKRRTQLTYSALFQAALIGCMVFFATGCSTLFDRVPSDPNTNSPALYQPSRTVTALVQQTGSAFGPIGQLAAGAALLALHAGALVLNQKRVVNNAVQQHFEDCHSEQTQPVVDMTALAAEIVKLLAPNKTAAPPG